MKMFPHKLDAAEQAELDDVTTLFPRWLRLLRWRAGLTTREVSRRTNFSMGTWNGLENGSKAIPRRELERFVRSVVTLFGVERADAARRAYHYQRQFEDLMLHQFYAADPQLAEVLRKQVSQVSYEVLQELLLQMTAYLSRHTVLTPSR